MLTPLLCASAVVFTTPPKDPIQMAFVARFYAPVGSKQTSHSEVYVSDLKGGHLRQLTHGADAVFVRWIGRDRLGYFRVVGSDLHSVCQLWEMNADGSHKRRVVRAKPNEWPMLPEPFTDEPGKPDFDQSTSTDEKDKAHHFEPYPGMVASDTEINSSPEFRAWLKKYAQVEPQQIPKEHEDGTPIKALFDHQGKQLWLMYWSTNSTNGE